VSCAGSLLSQNRQSLSTPTETLIFSHAELDITNRIAATTEYFVI
jgi:hypothetical protein